MINVYSFSSQFYTELLQWWSEFRHNFASAKDWAVNITWNNTDIRVNDVPILYKKKTTLRVEWSLCMTCYFI